MKRYWTFFNFVSYIWFFFLKIEIYTFPGFSQENKISPLKDKKFLMKIECQDQGVIYTPTTALISGCGIMCKFPIPPVDVLCSMKLSALISWKKSRDFFNAMFLLAKTGPNYEFLKQRVNISNGQELRAVLINVLDNTNLSSKAMDFKNLIFELGDNNKILLFREFIEQYSFWFKVI